MGQGILLVVSGFSGAGKGTLVKKLMSMYDNYSLSISMTTRKPRLGETNGKEYFFVDVEEFEQKIKENQVIEYARYCDNYYGTPREYVENMLSKGKDVILEIEIQGALKIKKQFPDALLLFVTPSTVSELKRRLTSRGTESEEVIDKRMRRASEESEGIDVYDYLIINDDLEVCANQMHAVVEAARNVPVRRQEFIKNIKKELKELSKGE